MHFVKAKGILSAQNGMNLYRGCTHGCIYCDSRSKCYNMKHAFEDIEVKENAIGLLEDTLKRKRKKCMICHWIRDYTQFGDAAFEPKKHSGNPFAALNTGKPLSETERLKLQLLKLEIENERLKKGYIVKGAGANKEFVSLRDLNTK